MHMQISMNVSLTMEVVNKYVLTVREVLAAHVTMDLNWTVMDSLAMV